MQQIHDQCEQNGRECDTYANYLKGANIAGFFKVADAMMAHGII